MRFGGFRSWTCIRINSMSCRNGGLRRNRGGVAIGALLVVRRAAGLDWSFPGLFCSQAKRISGSDLELSFFTRQTLPTSSLPPHPFFSTSLPPPSPSSTLQTSSSEYDYELHLLSTVASPPFPLPPHLPPREPVTHSLTHNDNPPTRSHLALPRSAPRRRRSQLGAPPRRIPKRRRADTLGSGAGYKRAGCEAEG